MASTQNNSTPPNNNAIEASSATPAFIKRQQFQQRFQSPTDNILSPCSRLLSDPVALMRQKQKPKMLSTAYANSAIQHQMKFKAQSQQSVSSKDKPTVEENKEN